MVIILDKPFSLGDLGASTYPHAYVSLLLVDGPNQTVSVQYEMGEMASDNTWTPTPVSTREMIHMQGAALLPFFSTKPANTTTSLWDQVETLVYGELQALVPRLAGVIGNPPTPSETPPATNTVPNANI